MMGSDERATLTFVCPACDEELAVDDAMKDALLEHGCVVCGTTVTADAFSEDTPTV
jgi:transcription initiation factor IIE alpha subunit